MVKFVKSFSFRLSLRFMLLLTSAVLVLSVAFVFVVNSFVRANLVSDLNNAAEKLILNIKKNPDALSGSVPYFISFVIFENDSEEILASNDPFLPLFKDTRGKARRFYSKDFFYDGDMNILYTAKSFFLNKVYCTVVTSMNMESNRLILIYKNLPKAVALIVIPILLCSFFMALYLTRNTIKPVVKITKSAASISSSNLEQLLPIRGSDDEIDRLSKTFNDLFQRLKIDFDRERQFSNDVSHELNTPLTVISGQTNLLLRWGKNDPQQLEKSLTAIRNESKSMQSIISNLLQMARIESGRVKPEIKEVSVSNLFERFEQETAMISSETVLIYNNPQLIIKTDEEMLHQIITVLISNSIKFCGKKCVIELWCGTEADGKAVIELEDNGPGFSEKDLPHIFERFYRGDESRHREAGGSGLGLAIAKTLAEAIGAVISAENSVEHGAKFKIKFLNGEN